MASEKFRMGLTLQLVDAKVGQQFRRNALRPSFARSSVIKYDTNCSRLRKLQLYGTGYREFLRWKEVSGRVATFTCDGIIDTASAGMVKQEHWKDWVFLISYNFWWYQFRKGNQISIMDHSGSAGRLLVYLYSYTFKLAAYQHKYLQLQWPKTKFVDRFDQSKRDFRLSLAFT